MSWKVHYRCHPDSENSQTHHVRESIAQIESNVLNELKRFSTNKVNCFSFGNWLLLSEFQQNTQQFSNLFHTFEEMPDPFKNLKSCKVDLSVLVILSCSPPVLWIKEISQFPITERFRSLLNLAVKRGTLLENDGTARSRAGLEFIWSLSDLSFGSQAENMKSFTRFLRDASRNV